MQYQNQALQDSAIIDASSSENRGNQPIFTIKSAVESCEESMPQGGLKELRGKDVHQSSSMKSEDFTSGLVKPQTKKSAPNQQEAKVLRGNTQTRNQANAHQNYLRQQDHENSAMIDAASQDSEEDSDEEVSQRYLGADAASAIDAGKTSMKRRPLKVTVVRDRRYIRMPNFTKRQVEILKEWLLENLENPYPGNKEKEYLQQKSGLCRKQIQNWFTNARKRVWQPIVGTHDGMIVDGKCLTANQICKQKSKHAPTIIASLIGKDKKPAKTATPTATSENQQESDSARRFDLNQMETTEETKTQCVAEVLMPSQSESLAKNCTIGCLKSQEKASLMQTVLIKGEDNLAQSNVEKLDLEDLTKIQQNVASKNQQYLLQKTTAPASDYQLQNFATNQESNLSTKNYPAIKSIDIHPQDSRPVSQNESSSTVSTNSGVSGSPQLQSNNGKDDASLQGQQISQNNIQGLPNVKRGVSYGGSQCSSSSLQTMISKQYDAAQKSLGMTQPHDRQSTNTRNFSTILKLDMSMIKGLSPQEGRFTFQQPMNSNHAPSISDLGQQISSSQKINNPQLFSLKDAYPPASQYQSSPQSQVGFRPVVPAAQSSHTNYSMTFQANPSCKLNSPPSHYEGVHQEMKFNGNPGWSPPQPQQQQMQNVIFIIRPRPSNQVAQGRSNLPPQFETISGHFGQQISQQHSGKPDQQESSYLSSQQRGQPFSASISSILSQNWINQQAQIQPYSIQVIPRTSTVSYPNASQCTGTTQYQSIQQPNLLPTQFSPYLLSSQQSSKQAAANFYSR